MSYVQLELFDTSFYVSDVRRAERAERARNRSRGVNLGFLPASDLEALLLKNDPNQVQVTELEFPARITSLRNGKTYCVKPSPLPSCVELHHDLVSEGEKSSGTIDVWDKNSLSEAIAFGRYYAST